jgi:hypothetical protein
MIIRLRTGRGKYAGTDDPLYLGVSGTGGGREFPLDVAWFDDFERGSSVKYHLGTVWDESAKAGARVPKEAVGGWNDPLTAHIELARIDRVYLRKQGRPRASDDAYQLDEIEVALYGERPERRVFHCTTAAWLGVEYGFQVWIPEVSPGRS